MQQIIMVLRNSSMLALDLFRLSFIKEKNSDLQNFNVKLFFNFLCNNLLVKMSKLFIKVMFLCQCCITVDTVCALLATAERYIQYKCTKFLLQKVSCTAGANRNQTFKPGFLLLVYLYFAIIIIMKFKLKTCHFPGFGIC